MKVILCHTMVIIFIVTKMSKNFNHTMRILSVSAVRSPGNFSYQK